MPDDVSIKVRLRGGKEAAGDAKRLAKNVEDIGKSAKNATASSRAFGASVSSLGAGASSTYGAIVTGAKAGAVATGALGLAGTRMGLSYNAALQNAQIRFELFTKNAQEASRLIDSVRGVDANSAFNMAQLSDSVAYLGNQGVRVQQLPRTLQAVANAAAASGKGQQALDGITIALGQIQSKGRLSQEEINQLNEAGAPGVQKTIQKAFGLTKDQLQNIGNAGLDSQKAVAALTEEWTSGKMANAAKRQSETLGGQWDKFTGNAQKASGALTNGLAGSLSKDVLPAANRAAAAITAIFQNDDGTATSGSFEQKMRAVRQVVEREMGPIADQLGQTIEDADIPQRLSAAVEAAAPHMADAAVSIAPKVAGAFVGAWFEAGPWTKLLTVALLAKKLGVFGVFGKLAAERFRAQWALTMTAPLPGGKVGPVVGGGVVGGGGVGGAGAKTRAGKVASGAGKLLGAAGIVGLGYEARQALKTTGTIGQYSGSKGFGELGRDVLDYLPGEDSEARRRRQSQPFTRGGSAGSAPATRSFSTDRTSDTRPTGGGRTPITLRNTTIVRIGDKDVARSVQKVNANRKARG